MKQSAQLGDAACRISASLRPRLNYVCFHCRQRAFTTTAQNQASSPPKSHIPNAYPPPQNADPNSLSEKLRRKLWGLPHPSSEPSPAAPEDPYGDRGIRDRDQKQQQQPSTDTAMSASDDMGDYAPAATWDGLESIGGPVGWWEEAWDEKNPFRGFMAPSKLDSREDVSRVVHRALVEIFTLREAGVPVKDLVRFRDTAEADYLRDVGFGKHADGNTVLVFSDEKLRSDVLGSMIYKMEPNNLKKVDHTIPTNDAVNEEKPLRQIDAEDLGLTEERSLSQGDDEYLKSTEEGSPSQADVEELGPTESSFLDTSDLSLDTRPNDETWLHIELNDNRVKFAVLKRVMQLTGRRISDPAIEDIKSAKALFGYLVKKPKPKKLVQTLMVDEELISLPNVKIFNRRYTPIDKEKQVGRWKVIEKELIKQGLPVTGGQPRTWRD